MAENKRLKPETLVLKAAMLEEIAVPEAIRKEILELEVRIGKVDLFTLLGVPPGASIEQVKKAYHEISRRIHPDRYFRKNVGTFKARIDKVFDALRKAQQTLTDEGKRAAYINSDPELKKQVLKWKPGQRLMLDKKDLPALMAAIKKQQG